MDQNDRRTVAENTIIDLDVADFNPQLSALLAGGCAYRSTFPEHETAVEEAYSRAARVRFNGGNAARR
jgi:hypothetical protein